MPNGKPSMPGYLPVADGCQTYKVHQWTRAEDALLGTMTDGELASRLGLTMSAVAHSPSVGSVEEGVIRGQSPRHPGNHLPKTVFTFRVLEF
jgi:hypothetical protein